MIKFQTKNLLGKYWEAAIINTTPHSIVLYAGDRKMEIPPEENIQLRVNIETKEGGKINLGDEVPFEVTLITSRPTGVDDEIVNKILKAAKEVKELWIITSRAAAELLKKKIYGEIGAEPARIKITVPATGPGYAVRDENGRIIGVKALEVI